MRSVFICGTGRCGTSAMASLFRTEPYIHNLEAYPQLNIDRAYASYEVPSINNLNDDILHYSGLATLGPAAPMGWSELYSNHHLWLYPWPEDMPIIVSDELNHRIKSYLPDNVPFCIKDPRLSFVADVWMPFAPNALVIAVFRSCDKTVESLRYAHQYWPSLQNIAFDELRCINLWRVTYRRILYRFRQGREILFANYESLWNEKWREHLANDVIGAPLNFFNLDASIRSRDVDVPAWELKVFELLRELDAAGETKYEALPQSVKNKLDALLNNEN